MVQKLPLFFLSFFPIRRMYISNFMPQGISLSRSLALSFYGYKAYMVQISVLLFKAAYSLLFCFRYSAGAIFRISRKAVANLLWFS